VKNIYEIPVTGQINDITVKSTFVYSLLIIWIIDNTVNRRGANFLRKSCFEYPPTRQADTTGVFAGEFERHKEKDTRSF